MFFECYVKANVFVRFCLAMGADTAAVFTADPVGIENGYSNGNAVTCVSHAKNTGF